MARLYRVRDVARVAEGYATTGAAVAGSVALGHPVTAAIAAGLTAALGLFAVKTQKKVFEEGLVHYPPSPDYAPHLGEYAKELYQASGLKAADYPICDFQPSESTKKSSITKMLALQAQTQNAAAVRIGKPVIMISQPLLKLLDDNEEKAVLAHEFAHAKAQHSRVAVGQGLMGAAGTINNALSIFVAEISLGFVPLIVAIGAGIVAKTAASTVAPKFMRKSNKLLSLPELIKKTRAKKAIQALGSIVVAGTLACFSPPFLGVWAAFKGLSLATKLIGARMARSNEQQADAGAVALGGDPLALITGLRKIELCNKLSLEKACDGNVPKAGFLTKAWQRMTASHPPVPARNKKLANIARKQGIDEARIQEALTGDITIAHEDYLSPETLRSIVSPTAMGAYLHHAGGLYR